MNPPIIPDHTLRRPIGRGAYGEVWLARNVMGAPRAVKIVWRRQFESDRPYEREFAGIQRYEPVSRSADGLVHVLHVGRNNVEGYFYYVMELADAVEPPVSGFEFEVSSSSSDPPRTVQPETRNQKLETYHPRTLRSDLKRIDRLPTADCLRLALDVVSGLGRLHQHGLVHRDVKPGNIIYVHGRAKLADIGLVSARGEDRTFVGTEGYIPPEGPGSPAADLYALGIVLYEASTGFSPEHFPDVPAEWFADHAEEDALELHEVILKACEGQRERRYQSAEEMQADLALLHSGQSVRHVRALERRVARFKVLGGAAAAAIIIALAGMLVANYRERMEARNLAKEKEQRQRTEAALFQSRLAEAASSRRSGREGQRFNALAAIQDAARLKPGAPELRDEAIAALATVDLREVARRDCAIPRAAGYALPAVDGGLRMMAVPTNRYLVELLDFETQQSRGVLPRGPRSVREAGPFSDDRRFLAVHYRSGDTWIWSTERLEPALKLPPGSFVGSGRFVGPEYLHVNRDGLVTRGTPEAGSMNTLFQLTNRLVQPAVFSPNGRWLAAFAPGRAPLQLIRIDDGTAVASHPPPPDSHFHVLSWSADSRWLAASAWNCKVYIYEAGTTNPPVAILRGHGGEVAAMAFHPEGRLLVTSSWDATTRLWDWAAGRTLLLADGWTPSLSFCADGRSLMTFFEHNRPHDAMSLAVFEVPWPLPCTQVRESTEQSAHTFKGPFNALYTPDSRWLAMGTFDGLRWYDSASGELVARASLRDTLLGSGILTNAQEVWLVSKDGYPWRQPWIVSNGTLRMEAPERLWNRGGLKAVTASADGRVAAFAGEGKVWLQRREVEADEPAQQLPGKHRFERTHASADGCWVASVPLDGDIREVHLWDTATGAVRHRFAVTGSANIAFSPSGEHLAINHTDGLTFYETRSGRRCWHADRAEPVLRAGGVTCSADGRIVAACLSRWCVTLLSALDGRVLAQLEGPSTSPVGEVAFRPDGAQLCALQGDHEFLLWDLRALRTELAKLGLDWQE